LQSPTEAIDKLSAVRSHRYFEKQQRPQPEIRQQNLRRHVESTLVASAYFEQKHRSQHFLTYVTYHQTELSHTFERQGRTVEHLSQLLVETASRGDPSIYPLGSFLVAAKAILSNHSNFVAACGALATLVAPNKKWWRKSAFGWSCMGWAKFVGKPLSGRKATRAQKARRRSSS
jgi:hypothetical protein